MADCKPTLYSYWRSSCSWRVRIALAHKGIEYNYKAIHLVKDGGEQRTEEYQQINPMQAVPTFVEAGCGTKISQSMAILEYLEETRPEKPLLPRGFTQRATVRKIANCIACDIQPVQNLVVLQYVGADKKMEWGKHWITRGFVALEKILADTAGKYCVGDEVTFADVCLVPQVYNANRFSVDMSQFPTINRVHDELVKLDAFKKAHPSEMPDAQ